MKNKGRKVYGYGGIEGVFGNCGGFGEKYFSPRQPYQKHYAKDGSLVCACAGTGKAVKAITAPRARRVFLWVVLGILPAFFIALFSMKLALLVLIGFGVGGFAKDAMEKAEYQSKLWKYNAEQKELDRKYEEEMREYREDQALRQQLRVVWGEELSQIKAMCEETKGRLRTAYAKDIIFPKYRNLTMVASIYEYLCAGRCTTLDGHEGAYNILETEIRLDQIIVQLDRVIANLEQIQQNQYMLYSAIQESNAQSARLLESTDRMAEQLQAMQSQNALQGEALTAQIKELQKSSELTAYHAERTQKELAYMNRMDYLTGRNDGPFRNVPPT